MKINNFNIGDQINGTFKYIVEDLKIEDNYQIESYNNRVYLKSRTSTVELFIDDTNAASRELLKQLGNVSHPIVRITRHIKKYKKLSVILYLYQDYKNENEFILYYSNDFQRIIENSGITGIKHFVDEQFILNNQIFYQANISNSVVNLIGINYNCSARQIDKNVFRLDNLVKTNNNRNNYQVTTMYGNSINILRQDDYLRQKSEGSDVDISQRDEVKYIKFWREYLKVEKNQTIINLFDKGSIKYNGKQIVGDALVFHIVGKENIDEFTQKIDSKTMLSYYNQPISELIKYKKSDKLYKADITNLNHNHELEIKNSAEVSLGIYVKVLGDKLHIKFNEKSMDKIASLPKEGYIGESYYGSLINYQRKSEILDKMRDKSMFFLKHIVLHGSVLGLEKEEKRVVKNTVKSDTLKAMFGRDDVIPTDNQKEAIRLALTTPDICLIQGPPGTGKTTIIRGLISRIKTLHNYSPKILVATEQHEALHNVVDEVQTELPPTIISFRQSDSEEDVYQNVQKYQKKLKNAFNEFLDKNNFTSYKEAIYNFVSDIISHNYDPNYILDSLDSIKNLIVELDDDNLVRKLKEIQLVCNSKVNSEQKYKDDLLNDLLKSQRLDIISFEDDGLLQLYKLVIYFKSIDSVKYQDINTHYEELKKDITNEEIESFKNVILDLIEHNRLQNNIFSDSKSQKALLEEFIALFNEKYNQLIYSSKEHVINNITNELSNTYVLDDTIKRYNSIFGSTCQQSTKFNNILEQVNSMFDYVIIDEASRVNPIDLLIPMAMGNKVILVGDQNQLPHYLERQNITELAKLKKDKDSILYDVLSESLFERIFRLLDTSFKQSKTKIKRCITLNEQYRMNPKLGTFISDEFYNGQIKNGALVHSKINNYGIFNDKNIAWLDLGKEHGMEVRNHSGGLERTSELDYILKSIKKLAKNFESHINALPNMGIISYYKKQIETIDKAIQDTFPKIITEKITCGTVDSFQGKEFDIVFLSAVRANNENNLRRRIGFLDSSKNRINVSLSRAKNLLVILGDSNTIASDDKNIYNKHFNNLKSLCLKEGYYEKVQI